MKIALIAPNTTGGVATVFHMLYKGLVSEGIYVDVIRLSRGRFPLLSAIHNDILKARLLKDYDLALYMGNIPWPSHILAKLSGIPVALFLHGYIYHELSHEILHGTRLRNRIGAVIDTTMFQTAALLHTIDLYICHSLATCEANKISKRFVLLPQWLFPEELEVVKTKYFKNNEIRIVIYTSYGNSPRLLSVNHLIVLEKFLEDKVQRKFKLIIVNPRVNNSFSGPVRIVKPMPRKEFLSFLASADLYIEPCIDEELRLTTLEAMAMGVPVAKLTHPRYWNRQDYGEGDLILGRSFGELAEKIAEYINHAEHYFNYYSKRGREFVLTKRTWDAVKRPFLMALKRISR
ncbi:MAG: hypothetical protein QXM43_06640 [Desulfurococcaceae archaeon]